MGYFVRPLDPDLDVESLLRLITIIEEHDRLGEDTSESGLRAAFEWYGHDPRQDRWVAVEQGRPERFLGYAWRFSQTDRRSNIFLAVHPDHRRVGIGSELLRHCLARASTVGSTQVVAIAPAGNMPAAAFLEKYDFEAMGQNRFMSAPGDVSLEVPSWPSGFSARPYADFQDLSVYVQALNLCYAPMWGHAQNTQLTEEERFAEIVTANPDYFDANGMFVVFDDQDRVCGVCSARLQGAVDEPSVKHIDSPAIAPNHQRTGLLRPLMLTVMRWLNRREGGEYRLDTWGDSQESAEIYQNLGFTFLEPGGLETEYLLTDF